MGTPLTLYSAAHNTKNAESQNVFYNKNDNIPPYTQIKQVLTNVLEFSVELTQPVNLKPFLLGLTVIGQ